MQDALFFSKNKDTTFCVENVTSIGNCFNRFYFDYKSIFNKFFIALIMTEKIAQIHIKLNTKVNH